MKTVGWALWAVVPLLSLPAPAGADFYARTVVQVVPGTVREMISFNGPVTDALTSSGGPGIASAAARAGLGLGATASADSPPVFGLFNYAQSQTRVLNYFRVSAGPGFNGTTARVDLAFQLEGFLMAADGAAAGVSAQILTTIATPGGGTARFDFVGYLSVPTGQFDSASVFEAGTLAGTVPLDTWIAIDPRLNVDAQTLPVHDNHPSATADFGSTLSFGVSSPDSVSIVWASDQFFSEQPSVMPRASAVPEPSGLVLLGLGLGGLGGWVFLRRRCKGGQSPGTGKGTKGSG